jgi:putative transcriptional regulator
MTPQHHPGDDLLIAYAAGSQDEPVALVVATHLALCPRCRKEVERLEALGGVLLEEQEAEALAEKSLEQALARLDEAAPDEPARPSRQPARRSAEVDPVVPRPLRDYLGDGLDQLDWTAFRGLEKVELLPEFPSFRTRLMRIKSGTAMPTHTHDGSELTLVLAGGFSDESGHFVRGDVAEADPSVNHQPVADPGEDCLCLAVTDAPLRLTGPFGRLLNPFLRI